MIEYLIVALIVGASAAYAGRRYLPMFGKSAKGGCGTGGACDSCKACAEPAAASAAQQRVIKIHPQRQVPT
jgi:hypothetical protein